MNDDPRDDLADDLMEEVNIEEGTAYAVLDSAWLAERLATARTDALNEAADTIEFYGNTPTHLGYAKWLRERAVGQTSTSTDDGGKL